jgi:AcrR family transcriptional regulator
LNATSKTSAAKARPERRPPGTPTTRQRLIQAVIDVVRGEGLGSLTTVEITRRAGIAQPGFYKHFHNVDECLEEATKQVLDGMRETVNAMRRRIRNRTDLDEVAKHFEAVLDAVHADKPFNELIQRYRRDPSPLGQAIREVQGLVARDFVEELWAELRQAGMRSEHRGEVELLAELMFGCLSSCVERVIDGRDADRPKLARELAAFMIAGTRGVLAPLLDEDGRRHGHKAGKPGGGGRS